MLSICIPVYNYPVVPFVTALLSQAKQLPCDFEILVWEDGSSEAYKKVNRQLHGLDPHLRYVEWEQNRGRSIIRNGLAKAASFQYILFLDCDAALPDDHFLRRYAEHWQGEPARQVICGGRWYPEQPDDPSLQLHWLYGSMKESQGAESRRLAPNSSFMTNNFLISRSIFEDIQFNEALQGYGHEDTLFGWELQKLDITIQHIDNPVIHVGLESSSVFLEKTLEGIDNLHRLHKLMGTQSSWWKEIKLLRIFRRLRQWRIHELVYWLLAPLQKPIGRQLHSAKPSLVAFDLYKLYRFLDRARKP
ncbi:MAG: glycosyltransferase family 2 protein [Saprospiraceae bacterium]|nr:glycosyltransferase family 2 protein [Saprospiraceae bacterium]